MSKATARNNYARRNYDRLLLQFPQWAKDRFRAAAAAAGFSSVNAWIAAVLSRETGEDFSLPGEFGPRKPAEKTEK